MSDTSENPVVEAVADLAHSAEIQADITDAIVADVIENAQERVEQAERTAEQIAAAAMESARGQSIEELRREMYSWHEESRQTAQELASVKSELSALTGQIAALATLEIASQTQVSSSLTPPPSETVEEAITETLEILPGNLGNDVAANPEPVPPATAKRRRWI